MPPSHAKRFVVQFRCGCLIYDYLITIGRQWNKNQKCKINNANCTKSEKRHCLRRHLVAGCRSLNVGKTPIKGV